MKPDDALHEWTTDDKTDYEWCRKCLLVRQANGSNDKKPCKGPARVGMRSDDVLRTALVEAASQWTLNPNHAADAILATHEMLALLAVAREAERWHRYCDPDDCAVEETDLLADGKVPCDTRQALDTMEGKR